MFHGERAEVVQRVLAELDHLQTNRMGEKPQTGLGDLGAGVWVERHRRGGEEIGVRRPGDTLELGGTEDVIHDHIMSLKDPSGPLLSRWRLGNPPEGFTVVTSEELQKIKKQIEIDLADMATGPEMWFGWPPHPF